MDGMINASLMTADLALMKHAQNAQKNLDKDNLDMQKIEDAATEFEAVFISEMMKPMFEGIKTDNIFGGGKGEEVFRGMMIQEYGKTFANTGGLGIADSVKAAIIEMQAQASNQNPSKQNSIKNNMRIQNFKNGEAKQ